MINKNKFGAVKTVVNGITFDSKKEADYYRSLLIRRKASNPAERVVNIELQPLYKVQIEGKHICNYKADFKTTYADGRVEVVDVKGLKKGSAYQLFRLKKKLVEAIHNIEIIEK